MSEHETIHTKRRWLSAAFIAALGLAACSAPPADTPAGASRPKSPETLAQLIVAERTGVRPEEAIVLSSEFREFRDSSLGCPLKGRSYLQVITEGHQVLVEAAGKQFDVRVAGGNSRICDT